MAIYIFSFKDTEPPNLGNMTLDYSSFIYTETEPGVFEEYMMLHDIENRVWVDYADIPQIMIDAILAIEDKRFFEHDGVDWRTTFGAVTNLVSGGSGGGSTITQQLIKNLTGKNQVSLNRKVEEIFMALNLEKAYTKDEILEAYLNVVNFGGGTRGVQAAANLYFGKDISECTIAECACIAGITQYPYLYTPLYYPENNKEKQLLVLKEMYDQERISLDEYTEAKAQANNMQFFEHSTEEETTEEEEDTPYLHQQN